MIWVTTWKMRLMMGRRSKDLADDVANGFDDYDDAHDYLINKLSSDGDGQYEVKIKTKMS